MTAVKTAQRTYSTRIDLPEDVRKKMIELLNKNLASSIDIWTQTKYAHWNVKGMNFYQLHLLFDEIAEEQIEFIDLLAERVTTLGGTAQGTCRMAAANSGLTEYDTDVVDGARHIATLSERLAQYGKAVRAGIDTATNAGDADTADIFTEISRKVDMRLWFLEAHTQQ